MFDGNQHQWVGMLTIPKWFVGLPALVCHWVDPHDTKQLKECSHGSFLVGVMYTTNTRYQNSKKMNEDHIFLRSGMVFRLSIATVFFGLCSFVGSILEIVIALLDNELEFMTVKQE